jgi:hypothetical protein
VASLKTTPAKGQICNKKIAKINFVEKALKNKKKFAKTCK